MSALTEFKVKSLQQFREGLLDLKRSDLSYKSIFEYVNANRKKISSIAAGDSNSLNALLYSVDGVEDADVIDSVRDEIIGRVDEWITALDRGAQVRPVLEGLILKVKDTKLSTLLKEFNSIKDSQPNLAAIGLRTILCLVIQQRAKALDVTSPLSTREDLSLQPMLDEAIKLGIFPEGQTKLLQAYRRQGLKEHSDNVVHKPGSDMLVTKDDLSAAVDLLNKLLATIV